MYSGTKFQDIGLESTSHRYAVCIKDGENVYEGSVYRVLKYRDSHTDCITTNSEKIWMGLSQKARQVIALSIKTDCLQFYPSHIEATMFCYKKGYTGNIY